MTKKLLFSFFLFFCLAAVRPCRADVDILPLDQVKVGDRGYSLTVFEGKKIEKFEIRVKAIVPAAGPDGGDMILVKLSGDKIDEYGGVALGMSGSPVYIHDKLAGAISIAFPETDFKLAGVTPIQNMLQILDYGEAAKRKKKMGGVFRLDGRSYAGVRSDGAKDGVSLSGIPALAPVVVSGLNDRALGRLRDMLLANGIRTLGGGQVASAASASDADAPVEIGDLKPGAAVAVQLMRGDVDISAVGTLTYVDGDAALIFGHPFMRKGKVDFLLSHAYVHAIINGDPAPYKLGSAGAPIGRATQDRGSALLGQLGDLPDMIPVDIQIRSKDIDRQKQISVKIIRDEELMPMLLGSALLQGVDNALDRVGRGTARVSFRIKTKELHDPVERENMHSSRYDVALASVDEVVGMVHLIANNQYEPARIESINIDLDIDDSLSFATIEKAVVMPDYLLAGESGEELKEYLDALQKTPSLIRLLKNVFPQLEWEQYFELDEAKGQDEANPEVAAGDAPQEKGREELIEEYYEGSIPDVERGEDVRVNVTLRPFRGEFVKENLVLHIPDDFDLGEASIDVYSGMSSQNAGTVSGDFLDFAEEPESYRGSEEETGPEEEEGYKDLSDIVDEFLRRGRNNELVASLVALGYNDRSAVPEDRENEAISGSAAENRESPAPALDEAKKSTPWVIQGQATVKVNVIDKIGGRRNKSSKKSGSAPRTLP